MTKRPELLEKNVNQRDLIEGLMKGIEVISAFSEDATRLSATELAEKVGISRSAARRYLLTLLHMGFAATDGREFWLTPKVATLGNAYLDSARLPRAITPFLQRLTMQINETSNYSVLVGDEVVYLCRVNAPHMLKTGYDPGTRMPAYTSTAGRVLLSALPDDQLHAYLERVTLVPYTHLTITNKDQLLDELKRIRQNGFGVTENQFEIGIRGVSLPLVNRRGRLIGALSASMLASSCSTEEAVNRCVPALQQTANNLTLWV